MKDRDALIEDLDIEPQLLEQFEMMGADTVRVRLEKFTGFDYLSAIEWLSYIDRQERAKAEAAQAAQMSIAKSAQLAAWIAAGASIVAIAVPIVIEFIKGWK